MSQTLSCFSVTDAITRASNSIKSWPCLQVRGELSGIKRYGKTGTIYATLKDEESEMSIRIYGNIANNLDVKLEEGLEAIVTGEFNLYTKRGSFSFTVFKIEPCGEGYLKKKIEELRLKLSGEGLMDPSRKKPIPALCEHICVVTSREGSVLHDVLQTLRRRNPLVRVDYVSCTVQGKDAPPTIIRALRRADMVGCDAILLVRGGGSLEDLMCFNDESLARCVAGLKTPVITGIGHEPDTSIADLVSDCRASTPTAAAEQVAPTLDSLRDLLASSQQRLLAILAQGIKDRDLQLANLQQRAQIATHGKLERFQHAYRLLAAQPSLQDPQRSIEARRAPLLLAARVLAQVPENSCYRARQELIALQASLSRLQLSGLKSYDQHFLSSKRIVQQYSPYQLLLQQRQHCAQLKQRMHLSMSREIDQATQSYLATKARMNECDPRLIRQFELMQTRLKDTLESFSPREVLRRGYSYVSTTQHSVVKSIKKFQRGDEIVVHMSDGQLKAVVSDVSEEPV